jgi:sec-independent protein translocase protein TatB
MFDFGFAELMLVMGLVIVVMGPNEIPVIMRGLGRLVRRIQYVRFAISNQFDDFMREHDLDITDQVNFEARAGQKEAADFDESESDEIDDILPPGEQEAHDD